MPIPKIIHFTIPARPSEAQLTAIDIAKRLHSDWKVMIWQDPVPPRDFKLSKYWSKTKTGAQLADLIRIEAVLNHGGVYIDSDVTLRKPLDKLVEHYDFFVASENGRVATNAVFGSRAGHSALEKMVESLDMNTPDWSLPPNITTGPYFFSRILKWRKDITVLPRQTFYPYNWNEAPTPPHPFTYGIHLWEGSWASSRAKPTTWQRTKRYLDFRNLTKTLARSCEDWLRTNERAVKLVSSKVRTYSVAERLVCKTIHGHSIILSGTDYSVTPEIAQRGYYELREELFLKRVLRGGDYFIDVGANAGSFSLLAASVVGPFGRVYAYEPNPLMAEMLRTSAVMNWVHERLVVSSSAVGERAAKAELRYNPSRIGGATLMEDSESSTSTRTTPYLDECKTVSVDVVALDEEFPCDVPIKALKIDAEGYEISVLRGTKRLLSQQCIDYLMLEAVEEVAGDSWSDFLNAVKELCNCGYSSYTLGRNGQLVAIDLAAVRNGQGMYTRNLILASHFVR